MSSTARTVGNKMKRPSRSDRLAHSKGRPKRRAATTHLFKYQLAQNPNRAEENALKKALQESLEEHKDKPLTKMATAAAATSVVTAPTVPITNKKVIRNKNNRVMNSSTNSSDVSRISNNSSSTSNESVDSINGNASKRTRSTTSSTSNASLSTSKRAKLTSNGHKTNNIISNNTNSNKDKCDNSSDRLTGTLLIPAVNRAIRTYSRNQQVVNLVDHVASEQARNSDLIPRSSTPISLKKSVSTPPENGATTINGSDRTSSDEQLSVSRSTQTAGSVVSSQNAKISNGHSSTSNSDATPSQDNGTSGHPCNSRLIPSVREQFLKFKRESKNYAYAKMTALKVNTYKSPYGQMRSTNVKKASPTGVLNNNTNKNSTCKTTPKMVKSTSPGHQVVAETARSTKKSPSPNTTREKPSEVGGSGSKTKSIPKHSSVSLHSISFGDTSNNTIDLSTINGQSQANVNVQKKRIAQGSWSLLGVPEEKIIYLRDDEPPRRLICYPAIKHVEGDVIQVRDSVLLRSGAKTTDLPYIAKVCAFWEDAETGGVMMNLFWYYRPEHTEDGRKAHHLPDEIFASRHRDVDSVECIEDKCYVLTFNEYCRYRKRLKMEQVGASWSLADVTIPVSNESYPRRNRIPDISVNQELVFCCRQIYDSRMKRLIKNPLINPKYGNI